MDDRVKKLKSFADCEKFAKNAKALGHGIWRSKPPSRDRT